MENPIFFQCKCFFLIRFSEVEHLLVGSIGAMFTAKVTDCIINEYGSLAGYALQLLGNVYRQEVAFISLTEINQVDV